MPKPNNAPQVNIQRPCYAMASTDGQTADITMYGDIVENSPSTDGPMNRFPVSTSLRVSF